jgi:hypothetical protein
MEIFAASRKVNAEPPTGAAARACFNILLNNNLVYDASSYVFGASLAFHAFV